MRAQTHTFSSLACTLVAATGLLLIPAAQAQAKDSLFPNIEQFSKGASDATDVTLDKNMIGMAGALGPQLAYFAGRLNFISVHDYEYPQPGRYSMAAVEAVESRLSSDEWHHIVHERSSTDLTDICVKLDDEGQWKEMVIIDAEPKELSFVHLEGHVSMADLKHLDGIGSAADPKLSQRPR